MSDPTAPPEMEVRIVLPHPFHVREIRLARNSAGEVSEIVVTPQIRDARSSGVVAYVLASRLVDEQTGEREKFPPLDLKVSAGHGVRLASPPWQAGRRRSPAAKPAPEPTA